MSKRKDDKEILAFIEAVRSSAPTLTVDIFTNGSCYQFFEILKGFEPRATAYYDGSHVITKIGEKYYDINGEVDYKTSRWLPLDSYGREMVARVKKCRYDERKAAVLT